MTGTRRLSKTVETRSNMAIMPDISLNKASPVSHSGEVFLIVIRIPPNNY